MHSQAAHSTPRLVLAMHEFLVLSLQSYLLCCQAFHFAFDEPYLDDREPPCSLVCFH